MSASQCVGHMGLMLCRTRLYAQDPTVPVEDPLGSGPGLFGFVPPPSLEYKPGALGVADVLRRLGPGIADGGVCFAMIAVGGLVVQHRSQIREVYRPRRGWNAHIPTASSGND
jgi:hypothetical protein